MSRFGDESAEAPKIILSPRARNMAQWLSDLTDRSQWVKFRQASNDLLLRELPDHWTADDCWRESVRVRAQLGPKASHAQWLSAVGWLVGEEERLPEAAPGPSRRSMHFRVQGLLAKTLQQLEARS